VVRGSGMGNLFVDRCRNDLKHRLLRTIGARRAHIVGCERSGTSMLTYAMVAFDSAVIHDQETSLWNYPSLRESIGIHYDRGFRDNPPLLVTKRNAGWWKPERIERLVWFVRRYGVFIINLIRDPRDVLTSKHPLDARRFYVEPRLWLAEMDATDRLMAALEGYEQKLTVRYEDIVMRPDDVQGQFSRAFGVRLRNGITSWKHLSTNVKSIGGIERMIPYMHQLRDFDPATIGRWRNDPAACEHVAVLLADPGIKDRLQQFMREHRYE
jgi:hypothetical protein